MAEYKGDLQMEQEMTKISWPEAPKIITKEIPGPKTEEVRKKELAIDAAGGRIIATRLPWAVDEAFGATVKDPDGNVYIDLAGGGAVVGVGYCHPKVVEVIRKQCGIRMHTGDYPFSHRHILGEKLSQIVPGNLKGNVRMMYGLSGSSSIDAAVKTARMATGRTTLLAFQNSFHGVLHTSQALSGAAGARGGFRPLMPYVHHVNFAYCYRCPFHLKYPECDLECAKFIDYQVGSPRSGIDVEDVAALVGEPVQAEGGFVYPPPGFLNRIKEMCQRLGILFITDEIQVGMGRTGKWWAVEHYGVEPDIMVIGKGLGGDLPFSAAILRTEIADKVREGGIVLTGSGNALSTAVAITNIDLLQNGIIDRAAILGDYAIACFKEMAKEREIIGDVRGKGLGIAVEMVKNRETKEPLTEDEMGRILLTLTKRGIIMLPCGTYGNCVRLIPNLVITKVHMDRALEIISETLKEIEGDVLK